jgi:phage terminase large subunit
MAQKNPDEWFFKEAKASDTHLIPEKELQRLKDTMSDDQYEQEMECSFDAALQGTYYADMINRIQDKDRLVIGERLYTPGQKVHVAADVGLRDSTAWWFWQPRPDGIAVIDYYEANGVHVDHYLGMLHDRGYDYHEIWLPFDAKAKTLATRRSTVEQFATPSTVRPDLYTEEERLPIRIVPRLSIQHGIDAARLALTTCWFDVDNCTRGLDTLRSYRRQWHEHSRSFSDTPVHDWASNGADAFRYLSIVAQQSVAMASAEDYTPADGTGALVNEGLTLDKLYKERDNDNWRSSIIRL